MERMEITAEIKSKVFAQYLGQEVKTPDGIGKLTGVCNMLFPGRIEVHFGANQIITKNSLDEPRAKRNYGDYHITGEVLVPVHDPEHIADEIIIPGGCNLLLRPLSEIKEEDILTVAIVQELMYDNLDSVKKWILSNVKERKFSWKSYQILQSKGYDLPQYLLGGKTLEQAGLAIYQPPKTEKE